MAKESPILMSVRASVGDINIANEESCIVRGLAVIKSKNSVDNITTIKRSQLTSLNRFHKGYKLTSYLKTFQVNYHLQISFLNSHRIFVLNSLYHIYKIFHLFHLH